jgi:hypothetical protein
MRRTIDYLEDKGDLFASKGNFKRAVRYFDRAAALGSAVAFHSAAYYLEYISGSQFIGVKRRYRRALMLGISQSAFNLAVNAATIGDRHGCYRWLSAACRLGNEDARKRTKEMASSGFQIPDFKTF